MRIRLLTCHGASPDWRDDTHEQTLEWAKRLSRYGVRWNVRCLPTYLDTLNLDPIFEQRSHDEPMVVIEDISLAALAEAVSDWDVTISLVACARWNWADDGEPVTHSLVVTDGI